MVGAPATAGPRQVRKTLRPPMSTERAKSVLASLSGHRDQRCRRVTRTSGEQAMPPSPEVVSCQHSLSCRRSCRSWRGCQRQPRIDLVEQSGIMAFAVVLPSGDSVRLVQMTIVTSLSGSYPMNELKPGSSPPWKYIAAFGPKRWYEIPYPYFCPSGSPRVLGLEAGQPLLVVVGVEDLARDERVHPGGQVVGSGDPAPGGVCIRGVLVGVVDRVGVFRPRCRLHVRRVGVITERVERSAVHVAMRVRIGHGGVVDGGQGRLCRGRAGPNNRSWNCSASGPPPTFSAMRPSSM